VCVCVRVCSCYSSEQICGHFWWDLHRER